MNLPTNDEKLDLLNILRHHLPATFPTLGTKLSDDQQRQLGEAKDKLLAELVLGQDTETRKAVFAAEVPVIEGFLSGHRARSAMAWLGIAFLVFVIVDKTLHAQSYDCTKETPMGEYFTYAAPRLKLEASMLSNLYKEGRTLEEQKLLLFNGTGDIPGVTLDFVAQNRTKLIDLTDAICRHGHSEALRHYRDDTSRDFGKWAKYSAPASSSAADKATPELTEEEKAKVEKRKASAKARADARRAALAAQRAAIDAEVATLDDDDRFIIRTLQSGMVPYIAQAPVGRRQFLDELPARLVANRERLIREVDARTARSDFDPADPVNLAHGLGRIGSLFEAEERITTAVTSLAEEKRAVCIIAYRLHNEPALVQQWQGLGHHSLQAYAEARLNMGAEIYRLAKIGRALIRFHYLVANLPDRDSEGFFKKMEHVEHAIQSCKGDSTLVERALITLEPEDFKEFSRTGVITEREFSKPVTQANLDQVYEFRSMMRHYRIYGSSPEMRLVALVDRDEARYVQVIIAQMEAELASQAAEAPIAISTVPIQLPAPIKDPSDATFEFTVVDEVA